MSVYKITSLQKSLEDTVPSLELDLANRQFNELTAKYRDLLQKENQLAAHSVALDTLKVKFSFFLRYRISQLMYLLNDFSRIFIITKNSKKCGISLLM